MKTATGIGHRFTASSDLRRVMEFFQIWGGTVWRPKAEGRSRMNISGLGSCTESGEENRR